MSAERKSPFVTLHDGTQIELTDLEVRHLLWQRKANRLAVLMSAHRHAPAEELAALVGIGPDDDDMLRVRAMLAARGGAK